MVTTFPVDAIRSCLSGRVLYVFTDEPEMELDGMNWQSLTPAQERSMSDSTLN